MEKKLAKISKAHLEIKERGTLSFGIFVDYEEGCSQGVGGISLDTWDGEKRTRVGTAYGCEMIRQLLLTLNVNDLTEAKGQMIWVLGESAGFSFTPKGIESLSTSSQGKNTLVFEDIYNEFIGEQ